VNKALDEDPFDRGYRDGREGRERRIEASPQVLRSFLDGLFGGSLSEKEERYRDAYEKGYIQGLLESAKKK